MVKDPVFPSGVLRERDTNCPWSDMMTSHYAEQQFVKNESLILRSSFIQWIIETQQWEEKVCR